MKIQVELTLKQCSRNTLLLYRAWNILSYYPRAKVTVALEGPECAIEEVKKVLAVGGLHPQEG